MIRWEQGRATVDQMLADRHLERVPANPEAAQGLLLKAHTHLRSAEALAEADVDLAYDALHAANRKALTALLISQGLRPTQSGGHIAVYEAVRAQLDPPLGRVLAPYSRIRRARNASDYLADTTTTSDDIYAELPACRRIVETAEKVLENLPPY